MPLLQRLKKGVGVIISLILAFLFWRGYARDYRALYPTPTPVAGTHITGFSRLGWEEVWRFRTAKILIQTSPLFPRIYTTSSHVLIPSQAGLPCDNDSKTVMVTALALDRGELLWQTCHFTGDYYTAIEDGYLDEARGKLYLNYGYTFITAYDVETGERAWQSEKFRQHTGYMFDGHKVFENELELLTEHGTRVFMDAATGAVLDEQPYDTNLWLSYDEVVFQREMTGLYALHPETGQVMWSHLETIPAYGQMRLWPMFLDDDVLFLRGDPEYILQRRNIYSGELVWGTGQRYASNFVLDEEGRVYILRQDSTLVIRSAIGETLDEISMGGLHIDANNGLHWLVYEHPYLLVYFGDTRDLIVLRRNP